HQPVAVGRNGVRIVVRGVAIRYGQFKQELRRFKSAGRKKDAKRQRVSVAYDPHDLRAVRVRDMQGRLSCVAPSNRFGGMSSKVGLDQVKQIIRDQRRYASAEKTL